MQHESIHLKESPLKFQFVLWANAKASHLPSDYTDTGEHSVLTVPLT